MFNLIPQPVKNMIDTIFNLPIQWLHTIKDMLGSVSLSAGKGINLNNYFSFFGYLPPSLQVCVKSLISSVVLLTVLFLIKAMWNMYLNIKNSSTGWT